MIYDTFDENRLLQELMIIKTALNNAHIPRGEAEQLRQDAEAIEELLNEMRNQTITSGDQSGDFL